MKYIFVLSLFISMLLIVSCEKDPVVGCTDSSAMNFDPLAEVDSGDCKYEGCTDPEAANFESTATEDSGNCIYPGCTDEDADNHDPKFNQDDGSCIYFEMYEGEYEGNFECQGPFSDLLDAASSVITKKPGDDNKDEITVIVSNPATEITLLLDGTITKEEITIDTYIENFEYTLEAGGFVIEGPFEVFVTGTLTKSGDTISGPVSIRIDKSDLALSVNDECTYTAVEK